MTVWQSERWLLLAGALGLAAMVWPEGLYLVALGAFGLPHVLWEFAWVVQLWCTQLPRRCLALMALALLLQAFARTLLWRGVIDASTAAACDLATLGLALAATLLLWPRVQAARRGRLVLVGLLLPVLLVWVADTPYAIGVLALLAIAHNFSPVALVPAWARLAGISAQKLLAWVFAAPVFLLLVLWAIGAASGWRGSFNAGPAEYQWLRQQVPTITTALLPALVWAQCLHYLCVIHVVPRALAGGWQGLPARGWALMVCAAMALAFLYDYPSGRGLYAVAAGVHAWLEWPLMLLGALGLAKPAEWASTNEQQGS